MPVRRCSGGGLCGGGLRALRSLLSRLCGDEALAPHEEDEVDAMRRAPGSARGSTAARAFGGEAMAPHEEYEVDAMGRAPRRVPAATLRSPSSHQSAEGMPAS